MTDQKMSDQKMSERSKEKNRENDRKKTSRKTFADFDQGSFQTIFFKYYFTKKSEPTKEEIEILVHGARNLPLHGENNVSIFASIKSMSDYENKIASKSTTTLKQSKNPNWVSITLISEDCWFDSQRVINF